ncbi:uncharacterized protein LOC115884887 [Sitophilus oryzae]|uniref:Uncharacterized protein LOC115884887 n=1 Tax=Sitophilus oryzae TaxID=7048 RepID=A0A6J2Y8C3_SITOR|nr:uncharacterized protein LOC115884887 [Sitophilus oryzae]
MGSYGQAVIPGFICRLCSKQKKIVIHLYTAKAKKLDLLNKIRLLPISLDKYDNLPKTVCESCIEKLNAQYQLFMRIRKSENIYMAHRRYHTNGNCPYECPLNGADLGE